MSQINPVPANPLIDRAAIGHILFILAFFMAIASDSSWVSSIVLALWSSSLIISGGKQMATKNNQQLEKDRSI